MNKERLASRQVKSIWGHVRMPVLCSYCPVCGGCQRNFTEQGMDKSGILPQALERALDLATRVDFVEAAYIASIWGLPLSSSGLGRLGQAYGKQAWQEGGQAYEDLAVNALASLKGSNTESRRFVMETDGSYVLERNKSEDGKLEGREVKSLIIYPLDAPNKRVSVSCPIGIADFRPLAQGLLRQAGVCQEDVCLGLGDGAVWVRDLLADLGAEHVLLDVFHAVGYLEKVLKALNLTDEERLEEPKRWLRGEVDGALWLQETSASYNLTKTTRQIWSKEAKDAWAYLQQQADLKALAYPHFKAQG